MVINKRVIKTYIPRGGLVVSVIHSVQFAQ